MNWFIKAQQNIGLEYQQLMEQAKAIEITGTGQSENIAIPGSGVTISAYQLLDEVKTRIAPILIENNVKKIDTSPIADASAQGLAISHEPGVIHVDVKKVFDNAKHSLPPTAQMDGIETDPDIVNSLIQQVGSWILGELLETAAHESAHVRDYGSAIQSGQPFTSVQEGPAEQFGQQTRQQQDSVVQPFLRSLPY